MNPGDIAIETIGTDSPIVLLQKQKDKDDIRQAVETSIHYFDNKNKEKVMVKIIYDNGYEIISR